MGPQIRKQLMPCPARKEPFRGRGLEKKNRQKRRRRKKKKRWRRRWRRETQRQP